MPLLQEAFDTFWRRPAGLGLKGKGRTIGIVTWTPSLACHFYKRNILNTPAQKEQMRKNTFGSADRDGTAFVAIAIGEAGVALQANALIKQIFMDTTPVLAQSLATKEDLAASPKIDPVLFDPENPSVRGDWIHHGLSQIADGLAELKVYQEKTGKLDCLLVSSEFFFNPSRIETNKPAVTNAQNIAAWFEGHNTPVFHAADPLITPLSPDGVFVSVNTGNLWCGAHPQHRTYKETPVGIPALGREVVRPLAKGKAYTQRIFREGLVSLAAPFLAGLFLLGREVRPELSRQDFGNALNKSATPTDFGPKGIVPVVNIQGFADVLRTSLRPGKKTQPPVKLKPSP